VGDAQLLLASSVSAHVDGKLAPGSTVWLGRES
jgi:hypothetical protein